jgi:hypothetical protein
MFELSPILEDHSTISGKSFYSSSSFESFSSSEDYGIVQAAERLVFKKEHKVNDQLLECSKRLRTF